MQIQNSDKGININWVNTEAKYYQTIINAKAVWNTWKLILKWNTLIVDYRIN